MAVKEVGRFVNTIHWQSDNSWQRELQRIKKYKKTVESAHEQIARTQYRASAGMIKAQQTQARAQEKIRKAALAAQMRSQKQLQTLERRMAREQVRHNKMMSGVVSGRSMAKQRTITTLSGMKNMFSTATLNKYRASLQRLNAQYAAGGMSVSMYNQKLAALRNEMRATELQARKLSSALKLGMSGFKDLGKFAKGVIDAGFNAVMMGTAGAAGLTKKAMDNSANRNSAYYGLMAMNKDDKAATDDQMKFIRNVSNAHGMDQKTAETGYMQWAASTKNMTENDRRALFEAMAIKGRSTGATGEQLQRAQVALSQMASKAGQVASEELKGQLAEALAGSQEDFREAYGKSIGETSVSMEEFNKAMKDGNVNLMKLLPHLVEIWNSARNTRAYAEAMKQPEMAMQRLKNAAYDASIAMFGQIDATDGVYTLAEMIDDTAQSLTQTLQENKGAIESAGEALAAFFDQLMYHAGQVWAVLRKGLEFIGVDTSDPAAVGKVIGKFVAAIAGLKVIKSVVGLFAPLISGLWDLGKALCMLLGIARSRLPSLGWGKLPTPGSTKPGSTTNPTSATKTAKTAVNAARGTGVGAGLAAGAVGSVAVPLVATELASEAITGEGILNDTFGGFDYYQRLRSATTFGDFFKALVGKDSDKAGWKVNENGEKVWHDERQGTNLWDNITGVLKEWAQPAEMYRPSVTANTSQALPAPSTGFNGAVPSQVMVKSSGDINAQFQVSVDENGLLRVVQKEVETAIGWEKTKEINMFASPNF